MGKMARSSTSELRWLVWELASVFLGGVLFGLGVVLAAIFPLALIAALVRLAEVLR